MTTQIHYLLNNENTIEELTTPYIQLTKSKNGKTGTSTFIFINPSIFDVLLPQKSLKSINGLYLFWGQKKILTRDIIVKFYKGKPILFKAFFLLTNQEEMFDFFTFIKAYSDERGLLFSLNTDE